MPPQIRTPYRVTVQVLKADGTARPNATLTLTNVSTGDSVNLTADANGRAAYDLANLPNYYLVGDRISVKQTKSHDNMEYFVAADGNETYPNFIQVENNEKFFFVPNMRRFKLNTIRHPSGVTIDLTRHS